MEQLGGIPGDHLVLPFKTCGVAGALCDCVKTTRGTQKALGQWEGRQCCLSTFGGVC